VSLEVGDVVERCVGGRRCNTPPPPLEPLSPSAYLILAENQTSQNTSLYTNKQCPRAKTAWQGRRAPGSELLHVQAEALKCHEPGALNVRSLGAPQLEIFTEIHGRKVYGVPP
jgi:hypothetical protein